MNALANGIPSKPAASAFSQNLVRQRVRFDTSRHAVADHCGVSVSKIESWERGEAVPDPATFKRLCGMFRQLAGTPPNYSSPIATIGEAIAAKIQNENKPTPPKPKPIEEFGVALRRIRAANGMTQAGLAKLFGMANSAMTNWEKGTNKPTADNLARLFEVLPELKAAIDAGVVKAIEVRDVKLRRLEPKLAIVPVVPVNENKAPEPVAIVSPPIDVLAARYGNARALRLRKHRELEILRCRIGDLEHELARLAIEEDTALAALDAVAGDPSK